MNANANARANEHARASRADGKRRGPDPAVEETLRLYHAWFGYLLAHMGTDTLRVKAGDIREALGAFSCTVSREGEDYVIRVERAGKEAADDRT